MTIGRGEDEGRRSRHQPPSLQPSHGSGPPGAGSIDEQIEPADLANPARALLHHHFGLDPGNLPIVGDDYAPIVGVHLQSAIECFVDADDRKHQLFGFSVPGASPRALVRLSMLIQRSSASWPGATLAAPDFVRDDTNLSRHTVLRRGLFLVSGDGGPVAIWVSHTEDARIVDVMAPTPERARAVVDELRALSYTLNPFKGHVFTVTIDCLGNVTPIYLPRPRGVKADEIVLPPGLLERIERHAIAVGGNTVLREAGMSPKRGILLHGRSGSGKTHLIRYLISQMPHYSVLIVPAGRMQLITARLAEIVPYVTPGVMVFDDVDLIAEDRSKWVTNADRNPLFSLLDLMDGVGEDADLLFILTTNLVHRLDDALASRPGRIDQAFEIPAPDPECRRRLFELYARELTTQIDDMDAVLARTEGVTGSFLKELVRRAALIALLEGDDDDDLDAAAFEGMAGDGCTDEDDEDREDDIVVDVTITDDHVGEALDQLFEDDDLLTAQLLGSVPRPPTASLAQIEAALRRHR